MILLCVLSKVSEDNTVSVYNSAPHASQEATGSLPIGIDFPLLGVERA